MAQLHFDIDFGALSGLPRQERNNPYAMAQESVVSH